MLYIHLHIYKPKYSANLGLSMRCFWCFILIFNHDVLRELAYWNFCYLCSLEQQNHCAMFLKINGLYWLLKKISCYHFEYIYIFLLIWHQSQYCTKATDVINCFFFFLLTNVIIWLQKIALIFFFKIFFIENIVTYFIEKFNMVWNSLAIAK